MPLVSLTLWSARYPLFLYIVKSVTYFVTVKVWGLQLVYHLLLKIVRIQWLHRNTVVNKQDIDGLKQHEAYALLVTIQAEHHAGYSDLLVYDRLLLEYRNTIMAWCVNKKNMWAHIIKVARARYRGEMSPI